MQCLNYITHCPNMQCLKHQTFIYHFLGQDSGIAKPEDSGAMSHVVACITRIVWQYSFQDGDLNNPSIP